MSLQGKVQLERRLKAIGNTQLLLRDVQIHAIREAKLLVPRKTGNLGRTIRVGPVTAHTAAIFAGGTRNVGYAGAIELGRRAVTIRPRPGRVGRHGRPAMLAWGGARRLSGSLRSGASPTTFAREVHQPARGPHPYLRPGLAKAAKGIPGSIVTVWNSAA